MATKLQENRELKATIKDLLKQSEYEKDFYAKKIVDAENQANNLEQALQKCIDSKEKLNDKIGQLQDDLDKYVELYASTKIVAQSLGEAVYYLTKEKTHG